MLSLLAKLGLDISGFTKGLRGAEAAGKKTAATLAKDLGGQLRSTIFAGISVGGLLRFGSAFSTLAANAKKVSREFGVSTDEAQQLEAATARSGGSTEEVGAAMTKVAQLRARIVAGDEKSLALTKALGLEAGDLTNGMRSNLDVLKLINTAVEKQGGGYAVQNVAAQLLGEKFQSVFNTMTALQNLGPIPLLSKEQIDEVARAEAVLADMQRTLLVAAGPRMAFWSRVLERGAALERDQPDQWGNLTRATWQELRDAGPTSSAPITAEEVARARAKMAGKNLPTLEQLGIPPADTVGKPAAVGASAKLAAFDPRIAAGGLASAGLFFGGAGNPLIKATERQTAVLERSERELQRIRTAIATEL
jgi:hypothetical protein